MADIAARAARDDDVMEVRIWFDQAEPPVGRLRPADGADHPAEEQAGVPFAGWLGLLRVLSDVLEPSEDVPSREGRRRGDAGDQPV